MRKNKLEVGWTIVTLGQACTLTHVEVAKAITHIIENVASMAHGLPICNAQR